jgi:hypothetical protein
VCIIKDNLKTYKIAEDIKHNSFQDIGLFVVCAKVCNPENEVADRKYRCFLALNVLWMKLCRSVLFRLISSNEKDVIDFRIFLKFPDCVMCHALLLNFHFRDNTVTVGKIFPKVDLIFCVLFRKKERTFPVLYTFF